MYPVLWDLGAFHLFGMEFGPIRLHTYGLMIACGFLLALFFMQRDARKRGIDPKDMSEMAFWALAVGVADTRVLHIIMYPENYSWSNPIGWIAVWQGGLVFQGALPAVLVYAYFALRRRNISFWTMADVVLPYVPLAQALGRMGCFFNGCCYGQRNDALPWALAFPPNSPPQHAHAHQYADFPLGMDAWSFPVHPTQLYSVILLTLIGAIMLISRRYWHPVVGFALPLYLGLYGVKRFIVEMFRGDGNPTALGFGLLTNQQVFSLMYVVAAVALAFYLRTRLQPPPGAQSKT